jgi:nucleoid-associated protein YgaU
MVDRALATALAASIAATPVTPAIAAEPPPSPLVFDINADGVPVPHIRPPLEAPAPNTQPADEMPTGNDESPVSASPTLVAPVPQVVGTIVQPVAPAAPISQSTEATHTVDSGDNLWVIADQHLRTAGIEPTNAVITSYWRHVIEANRPTLRSGDPNLIYAGEIINLPPIEVTQ